MKTEEYRQRIRAIHEAHEAQRRPFQGLHKEIIAKICHEHLPRAGKILELGSGFGTLSNLLPVDLKGRHIQIDWDETSNAENRTRHPEADIRTASATTLPLPDRSCSAVIGLCTFDAITNLGDTMAEAHRVLIPGSKLLAISDLPAQSVTQIQRMFPEPIPLPYTDLTLETPFTGLRFIPRTQLENSLASVKDEVLKWLIERYILDPAFLYDLLSFGHLDSLHALSNFGATTFPDANLMSMREIYESALYMAFIQNGFKADLNTYVEENEFVQRALVPDIPKNRNMFISRPDFRETAYSSYLPDDDEVILSASMNLIVATAK